ncbi:MAG: Leucine-, isoleucine-, valine-, threonine-, and alanine-binding protein [Syntrophomonadaceae bacterium]|nr:Leucine-, isoleucine-, valine-, threonine-, and alanine-binding protein [Bacillota bacterium]
MHKRISLVLTLLLSIVLLATGCGQRAAQPQAADKPYEVIRVGAIFDVTGTGAPLGVPAEQSARMVLEKVNAEGGINGIPLEVIFLNNESVEDRSVLAFKRLVDEDQVLAVAGASQSGTTLAMVPAATEAQVPLVSAAAAVSIVEPQPDRRWIFKVAPNDSHVIRRTLEHMLANGIKRIAWLSVNNAFGHSGKKQLELLAPQMGIEVLLSETFEAQDADMRVQLTRINAVRPDAVFAWGIPPAASIISRNYRELGLTMPLYHSHGVGSQRFLDLAEGTADGVMFAIGPLIVAEQLPDAHPQKPVLQEYLSVFEGRHGARSTFGAHGYDALMLIVQALRNTTLTGEVSKDRALLRDALEQVQNYVGIGGTFNFSPADHVGLNEEDLVMVRVENNEWKLITD